MRHRFDNPDIAAVFESYPAPLRKALLALRALILDTAAALDGVGPVEEALRWGQPSYLTAKTKSGTTIRIDRVKADSHRYALYVHCQTDLIAQFKERYPSELTYDGKRAVIFDLETPPPEDIVRHCIALALTYRARKGRS